MRAPASKTHNISRSSLIFVDSIGFQSDLVRRYDWTDWTPKRSYLIRYDWKTRATSYSLVFQYYLLRCFRCLDGMFLGGPPSYFHEKVFGSLGTGGKNAPYQATRSHEKFADGLKAPHGVRPEVAARLVGSHNPPDGGFYNEFFLEQ